MKRLSIYIPTYNRREFLRKQLDFIFSDAEEYLSEIEVIVSDNASDDGTGELVETLQENYPIVYHRNEKNLGIVANLWPSGRYCTGEFLWIIGDDDILERGVTGRIFRILNSHPDVNFIYLNYAIMNGLDLKYGYSIPVAPQELCPGYLEDPLPLVMDNLEVMTPPLVLSSAHLMRREIWNEVISVISYTELEGYGINFAAPLAAIKRGKAYFDPEISSYANYMNCSWRAEALRSFYGTQLSVLKLKDLGYTEEEIQKIQKGLLKRNLASLNGLRSNNPDFDQEEILRIENYLLRSVDCPVKKLS